MEQFLKNLLKKVKLNEQTINTILGGLVIVIIAILIFNYFKASRTEQDIMREFEEVGLEEFEEGALTGSTFVVSSNTYTVGENESLWTIAEKIYKDGEYWVEIAEENNLINPDYIMVGQELNIPQIQVEVKEEVAMAPEGDNSITGTKYMVQEGDHLWDICVRAYSDGYKWPEVAKVNNLAYPDLLTVGQELNLPR